MSLNYSKITGVRTDVLYRYFLNGDMKVQVGGKGLKREIYQVKLYIPHYSWINCISII